MRYLGVFFFDIEFMDFCRFLISSCGSFFIVGRFVINNENFNVVWRVSKFGVYGWKIGVYEESKVGI